MPIKINFIFSKKPKEQSKEVETEVPQPKKPRKPRKKVDPAKSNKKTNKKSK